MNYPQAYERNVLLDEWMNNSVRNLVGQPFQECVLRQYLACACILWQKSFNTVWWTMHSHPLPALRSDPVICCITIYRQIRPSDRV